MAHAQAAHIPTKPLVNYSDMPEVNMSLEPRRRPLPGRRGLMRYSDNRSKFQTKSLPLPSLDERDDSDTLPPSDMQVLPWTCPACTFVNMGELKSCEMCETPANTTLDSSSQQVRKHNVASSIDAPKEAHQAALNNFEGGWPSLPEAVHSFVDCEVSSVGSSWLDLGDEEDDVVEDGDILILKAPEQPAPQSWADRAKHVASQVPAVAIPAVGLLLRPRMRPEIRKHAKVYESAILGDDNWDLDCLEGRRMRPQFDRGSAQRRRAGRGPL